MTVIGGIVEADMQDPGKRENVTESRASTDASLDAERATSDADAARHAARSQRSLDDVIERDRLLADARLMKYRASADHVVARRRSESDERAGAAVVAEQRATDEGIKAEREVTDRAVAQERGRADAGLEAERREQDGQRARLEAHRQDTDEHLSTERQCADDAVVLLGAVECERAAAQGEGDRRRDVLAMVTHDLRSPLSIIVINAGLIVAETNETASRESAQDVLRATACMERLLVDLLDVARIESGILRIVKRVHDVGVLMAEVLRSYRPLFAARGQTFDVHVPATAVLASFDHGRIVQVLSNLLGNAMKFTPSRGAVDMRLAVRDDAVELALHDNGPGVSEQARAHLFERFSQIDSEERHGLGLGLYIARSIVEAHGGRIWVESELGRGTTFRSTLPRSETPAA